VVALLDECALNARQSALADWAGRPLQQEMFGGLLAGEWFFQHVDQLLARPDTAALADVLEVYQLCLLLGFRGRYSVDSGALYQVARRIDDRLGRLRGKPGDELVSNWRPPNDAVVGFDHWVRRLTIGLAASVVLAILLWGASALSLRGGTTELAKMASTSTVPAAR
jgi:type VI secretion system protein ImpK